MKQSTAFAPNDAAAVRDLSWVGDAVLALCAREWLLENERLLATPRAEAFQNMTSNRFLLALGSPTLVEAGLGHAYREGGLAAARAHFDREIIPLFLKQEAKRRRH